MCGLVSVFGKIYKREEDIFRQMLLVDQLRGVHSTGVFSAARGSKESTLVKVLGTPDGMFENARFQKIMASSSRVLMGHNRAATHGAVTTANAHPFDFGSIVGMHNGTLTWWKELEGAADFTVDSQALYNHIAQHGLQDAVNNCYGAMALIWWDRETECMNVYRNDQRPLWAAYSKDHESVMLASEWWMISGMASRNGLDLSEEGVVIVPEKTHFSWHIPQGQVKKLEKPEARKVDRKVTFAPTASPFQGNVLQNQHHPRQQQQNGAVVARIERSAGLHEKNIRHGKHDQLLKEAHSYEYIGPCRIRGLDYAMFCALDPDLADVEFVVYESVVKNTFKEGLKEGSFYTAKCSGSMPHEKGGVDYYLLMPGSFRQIGGDNTQATEAEPGEAELEAEVEEKGSAVSERRFRTSDGEFVSESEWVLIHGTCDCCTGHVSPQSALAVRSMSGQGRIAYLCEGCAGDSQTTMYYDRPNGLPVVC